MPFGPPALQSLADIEKSDINAELMHLSVLTHPPPHPGKVHGWGLIGALECCFAWWGRGFMCISAFVLPVG